MEREVLVKWCQHVKPEFTRKHIVEVLGKMFGVVDYGFSTFSALYPMFPRATRKPKKNDFGFVLSQAEYLQKAFLTFIKGKSHVVDPLCSVLPNQE
jgi:hypothetical protein